MGFLRLKEALFPSLLLCPVDLTYLHSRQPAIFLLLLWLPTVKAGVDLSFCSGRFPWFPLIVWLEFHVQIHWLGCGSKLKSQGYAGFSLWCHLPRVPFWYMLLSHSHLFVFGAFSFSPLPAAWKSLRGTDTAHASAIAKGKPGFRKPLNRV